MNTKKNEDEPVRAPRVLGTSFRIGRLFGVDIRVDWSLLIIFTLITVELGLRVFPSWHPGWHPAVSWGTALGAAVAFFASVLAHELSHAVVGNASGIPVRGITLFLFGGLAHMEAEPESPKSEFWMAVVGPVTSVVIGVLATVAGLWVADPALREALGAGEAEAAREALTNAGPGATLLLWLGPINVLLAVFNLIPGFPLDGGRVLRSILWASTKNLKKATRWAARVGQIFAWTLMAIGFIDIFTGSFLSGLWLLLIGWFLNNAARGSYQQLLVREALEGVPLSRVMRSTLARVPPELSVEAFVRDYALPSEQEAFPVEDEGGRLLGLVSVSELPKLEQEGWGTKSVSEIMVPADELRTLPPDADARKALEELSRRGVEELLVSEGERLLGLVRRRDLMRWLSFHELGAGA